MYGDIKKAGECSLRVLEFGIPIPFETLNDEVVMKQFRSMFRYNPDMPGAIELVHPNKFLPSNLYNIFNIFSLDLRPVEDFRHTPLIPISEKDLALNKRKIEEANRKGYYVEIKKDTIYFYVIASLALGIIGYVFFMVNEKQMKIKHDIDRTRVLKQKASGGSRGGNISAERKIDDLMSGRTIM